MNKAIKIVGDFCLLVGLAGVPAKASILNNGLTYTMSAANLNTMNAQFNMHITGINAATDTEGGRYGVESFAFEGANLLTGEDWHKCELLLYGRRPQLQRMQRQRKLLLLLGNS